MNEQPRQSEEKTHSPCPNCGKPARAFLVRSVRDYHPRLSWWVVCCGMKQWVGGYPKWTESEATKAIGTKTD